jgi:hypothetical protein
MFVEFRARLTSAPLGAAPLVAPNGAKSFLLFNLNIRSIGAKCFRLVGNRLL